MSEKTEEREEQVDFGLAMVSMIIMGEYTLDEQSVNFNNVHFTRKKDGSNYVLIMDDGINKYGKLIPSTLDKTNKVDVKNFIYNAVEEFMDKHPRTYTKHQ